MCAVHAVHVSVLSRSRLLREMMTSFHKIMNAQLQPSVQDPAANILLFSRGCVQTASLQSERRVGAPVPTRTALAAGYMDL